MKIILQSLIVVILFVGCDIGGFYDDDDNETTTSSVVSTDITDAILTNFSSDCSDYIGNYSSIIKDVRNNSSFEGSLVITEESSKCYFDSNGIPNHDFNDASDSFPTTFSSQNIEVSIVSTPSYGRSDTNLSLTLSEGIFLNGVKINLLAKGCFGVGDGETGCTDITAPYRINAVSLSNSFGLDTHNGYTSSTGEYNYYASPKALFNDLAVQSPVVGFAADGFPIYGSYIEDNGTIRKLISSYQLKSGDRVAIDGVNPGGSYDGTYRDDYEYNESLSELDECNGMEIDGDYAYYITDGYPYILNCFKGTPDISFIE